MRSKKLGKKQRSTGSVFSLPTECLWDCTQHSHGLRQDPCSGSVAAPEGQNFSSVLSPSDCEWQKRFPQGKAYELCQLHCHVLTSTQARESNTRVLLPLQPLHSYPQDQAQSLAPSSSPHKGDEPETAPAGYNTHLH